MYSAEETILVTGGCGFIGSAVVRRLLRETEARVVNVDKLTYAGHEANVAEAVEAARASAGPGRAAASERAAEPGRAASERAARYTHLRADVADDAAMRAAFEVHRPTAVLHLAAESHVDRSIDGPAAFIETNITGTYTLLEAARAYWSGLSAGDGPGRKEGFRFLHVSTDEVYGTLGETGFFTEETPYDPSSPYSASKAASDHLVRAWHRTYGLPALVTNCSNNYGPYQYPEKLIPVAILNAREGRPIPVYGEGKNVRDWLYVEDHAAALLEVAARGSVGETYNVGGHNEKTNLEVVRAICGLLDELVPELVPELGLQPGGEPAVADHASLITFVRDRPGHDFRYAIDASKIERELGWRPAETFESGLRKTVRWYLTHRAWCEEVTSGRYDRERLGLGAG